MHYSVQHIHTIGSGCPDVIIGTPGLTIVSRQLDPAVIDFVLKRMGITGYAVHVGANLLVELKDGSKPPSAQRLTSDEAQFHSTWQGQVSIVNSPESARKLVGLE